jgi:hypothetical protein
LWDENLSTIGRIPLFYKIWIKKINDFEQNTVLIQINKGTCDFLHIKVVMLGPKLGHEYWQ